MADDSIDKYAPFGLTKEHLAVAELEEPQPYHLGTIKRVQAADRCIERGIIPKPIMSIKDFLKLQANTLETLEISKKLLFFDCIGSVYHFDDELNEKDFSSSHWIILANEQHAKSSHLYIIRSHPWVTVVNTKNHNDFTTVMSLFIGRLYQISPVKRIGIVVDIPNSLTMVFDAIGIECIHFIPPMELSANVLRQWELVLKYPSIEKKSLQKQFCERWRGTMTKFAEKFDVASLDDVRQWLRGAKPELDELMTPIIKKLGQPKSMRGI